MNHTPEPWWEDQGTIVSGEPDAPRVVAVYFNPNNRDRLIACVNACAGMEDPAKEIAELREIIALFVREAYERNKMNNAESRDDRAAWRAALDETIGVLLRRPIVADLMKKYIKQEEDK